VPPAASAEILGGYSDAQLQDFPDVATLCHRYLIFHNTEYVNMLTLWCSGGDDASCPDSSVDAMAAESLLDLRAQPRSTLCVLLVPWHVDALLIHSEPEIKSKPPVWLGTHGCCSHRDTIAGTLSIK
jgi:hypothetical protein